MKKTLAKTLRSALALVLALCLTVGTASAAFAVEIPGDAEKLSDAVEKLFDLVVEYGPTIKDYAKDYAEAHGYIDELNAAIDGLKAELDTYIDKYIDLEDENVQNKLDALKEELAELKADAKEIAKAVADKKEELKDATGESADEAKAVLDEMENVLKTLNEKVDITVDLVADLRTAVAGMDGELKALAVAVEALAKAGKDIAAVVKEEGAMSIVAAKEAYVAAREALFAVLGTVDAAYTYIDDLALDIVDTAKKAVAAVKDLAEFVKTDVKATVEKISKQDVLKAVSTLAEKLDIDEEAAKDAAGEALDLAEKAVEILKEKWPVIKAAVKKAYKDATTAHYTVNCGCNGEKASYYVAIGDDSAAAESYVDALAGKLLMKGYYNNLAKEGLLIQDAAAYVKQNASEIAKADLITVGFSGNAFVADTVESLIDAAAGEEFRLDWEKYLPDEAVPYLLRTIEEIEAYLDAMGINTLPPVYDLEMGKAITATIESFAYATLVYAWELPGVVNAIRDINADAIVAVVGMDNPLANATVEIKGKTINVGKVLDLVVKASDAYGIAYAMVFADCIYVTARDAANDAHGTDLTPASLMAMFGMGIDPAVLPNAEGHNYIKDRLYNALNVTPLPLGDVNHNGKVTCVDAMLTVRYAVKLITEDDLCVRVADVNGDGKITASDAMHIVRYAVKLINKFPCEI